MLILLSLSTCGPHFTYDNPSVLQSQIQKEYDLNSTYFSYLYSIYAAPNIVLPFFGGIFIQRWGKAKVIIVTALLTVVGQVLQAIAAVQGRESYAMLLAGRMFMGFGGETLYVVQAVYVSEWFYDQELTLAMAVSQLPNLVSYFSGNTVPAIG